MGGRICVLIGLPVGPLMEKGEGQRTFSRCNCARGGARERAPAYTVPVGGSGITITTEGSFVRG